MKTSLVTTTASQAIKADAPQQLKSVTVYFRGRKMVLMQRPQRRLSLLLCRMLRRSMLNLLGRLQVKLAAPVRKALSAGALCAMALASVTTAHATGTVDTLPVNTLPTNPTVTYGTAGISTTGSQMNVDIGTNKAVINWGSFSIGSQAGVDFHFDNATASSSVLNRVIGNDPSKIMGSLTSNGKVFLINAAGILVGKTAKIDVAGFAASTLNIQDNDFLNGKMSFNGNPNSTAGVVIEQDGSIKTKEGGSVYLIGANVENNGVITSPSGEVLLAAGSSVDLVDTGTPGVKINVKAGEGQVTNLGKIMAEAGTIGFGAALINNSGVINASSVDKVGGRIFLRASKDLTTTETSTINADGTVGGNVVLYADNSANIDGDVSALGSAGKGGYVDTSGKMSLAVKYVPRVGAGGEWYIDPYNVAIVASGTSTDPNIGGVITASGNSSTISASVIETALNGGTNITISTGTVGSSPQAGDIEVDTQIVKSGGSAATLTLTAAHDITIYATSGVAITDGSDGITNGGLSLVLNAGNQIQNIGGITVGGNLTANSASFDNSSSLFLGGGTASFASDLVNNFNGTIAGTGNINMNGHTLINNAGIVKPGYDSSTGGTLTVTGNYQQNAGGTLEVKLDRSGGASGPLVSDHLNVTGNVILAGTLKVDPQTNYSSAVAASALDKVAFLNYGGNRGASFFTSFSGLPSTLFVNYLLPISGSGHDVSMAYAPAGSTYFSGAGGTSSWNDANNWTGGAVPVTSASVYIDVGSSYSVMHTAAVNDAIAALDIASGNLNLTKGELDVSGTTKVEDKLTVAGGTFNSGGLTVAANGTAEIDGLVGGGVVSVSGILNVTGGDFGGSSLTAETGGTVNISGGTVTFLGTTSVNGALNVSGGSLTTHGLGIALGKTMHVSGGAAQANGITTINGTLNVDGTGELSLYDDLNLPGTLSIGGSSTANLAPVYFSPGGVLSIGGSSTVTLDSLTAQGGGALSIGDTAQVTLISSCFSSNVSSLTMTGGTFDNTNADFMTGDLSMSGGQITSAQDTTFTVRNNFSQTAGSITINGNGSFTQSSGNLVLGTIGGNGNLNLSAEQGAITQRAGTTLQANSIDTEATSGITLTNVGNNVTGSFSARNEGGEITSGDISFTNSGAGALTLGELSNSSETGDITIITNGTLSTSGDYSVTAGGGTVSLTSKGHMSLENYGGINATNINLTTNAGGGEDENYIDVRTVLNAYNQVTLDSAGSIYDNIEGNAGVIASSVVATARNGSIFMRNGYVNSIGSFTGSATKGTSNDDGSVSVNNTGPMTVGNVSASGDINLSTNAGFQTEVVQNGGGNAPDMTLTGRLSTTGGNVTLYSDGAIFQNTSPGSGIVANSLDVTALNGISLGAGNNAVSAFTADNSGDGASGDIVFKNTSTGKTSGTVGTLTTGWLFNANGSISVENTGAMVINDSVDSGGAVSLVTHSPLTINGTVNANGNISFAAGSTANPTLQDNLVIWGAVTSATGSVGMTAGNGVTLNALVNGPTGFTVSAPSYVSTVTQPVAPTVTITAGPGAIVTTPNTPPVVTTTTVDQNVASTTNNVNNVTDTTTPTTTQTNTLNSTSNQTAGGGDGEFGGSKDDGKGGKGDKSGKPAPVCS